MEQRIGFRIWSGGRTVLRPDGWGFSSEDPRVVARLAEHYGGDLVLGDGHSLLLSDVGTVELRVFGLDVLALLKAKVIMSAPSRVPRPAIELRFTLADHPELGVGRFRTHTWSLVGDLRAIEDYLATGPDPNRAPLCVRLSLERMRQRAPHVRVIRSAGQGVAADY